MWIAPYVTYVFVFQILPVSMVFYLFFYLLGSPPPKRITEPSSFNCFLLVLQHLHMHHFISILTPLSPSAHRIGGHSTERFAVWPTSYENDYDNTECDDPTAANAVLF